MNIPRFTRILPLLPVVAGLVIAGCGSSGSSSSTTGATAATTTGSSPTTSTSASEAQSAATGDIPDNQQFLTYRNTAAGYSILYPEGWARKGSGNDVTFADKDNQVHVAIAPGSRPSVAAAKSALSQQVPPGDQLSVTSAKTETISGTPMIHITYRRLGPSDPVTGKRLTLMVDRYVVAGKGQVATVDESTPVGVDNVDAYLMIIESFKWG